MSEDSKKVSDRPSNAPAALYWYHQQPDALGYRNSSANSTGPWTSSIDPTGKPGVFNLVKYVPEVELAAERKKVALLLASLKDVISWVPGREKWHTDEPIKAVERARAVISVTVKESLTAGQQGESTP